MKISEEAKVGIERMSQTLANPSLYFIKNDVLNITILGNEELALKELEVDYSIHNGLVVIGKDEYIRLEGLVKLLNINEEIQNEMAV